MGIVEFGKKKLHEAVEAERKRQREKKEMRQIEKEEYNKAYREESMKQARQRGHDMAIAKLTKKKKTHSRGAVFRGF